MHSINCVSKVRPDVLEAENERKNDEDKQKKNNNESARHNICLY